MVPAAKNSDENSQVGSAAAVPLAPGNIWHGKYRVEDRLRVPGRVLCFHASHVTTGEKVLISSFAVPGGMEARERVWTKLQAVRHPAIAEPMEAVVEGGLRIEVWRAPTGTNMRLWQIGTPMEPDTLRVLVEQLSGALTELHRVGIAHLNLRPETVFAWIDDMSPRFVLAGLEYAILYADQSGANLEPDPFYAPPESVGQLDRLMGTDWCAWDWWTLGRLAQERILGGHVFDLILGCDGSYKAQELRSAAEEILEERDANSQRSGAVEMMPGLEGPLVSLMRGLLASAHHARWKEAEIAQWLRGEPVKDHYVLAKTEKLFLWKDHEYTVPEIAVLFMQSANWADGLQNLFEPKKPGTLAAFLAAESAQEKTWSRLQELTALGESPTLSHLPKEVVQDVVAAVCLLFLSGDGVAVVLRGRKLDTAGLKALAAEGPRGLAAFQALTSSVIIRQVEQFARDAARVLTMASRLWLEASTVSTRHKWLTPEDTAGQAELFRCVVEDKPALAARHAALRKTYAGIRDAALDQLFKGASPSHAELAIIAYTERDLTRFGYLKGEEWNAEQIRLLRERGARIVSALFWVQLRQAVRSGPLVFGSPRLLAIVWGALTAPALTLRHDKLGLVLALGPVLLVIVLRLLALAVQRNQVRRHQPKEGPWQLPAAAARCEREAAAATDGSQTPDVNILAPALAEVNSGIAALMSGDAKAPTIKPTSLLVTWLAVALSWLALAGGIGGLATSAARYKLPEWAARIIGTTEDEAGKPAKVLKVTWDYKVPDQVFPAVVQRTLPATAAQSALALEKAEKLLTNYVPESVKDCIAVRVPTDSGFGMMVYDGRKGALLDSRVHVFTYLPLNRAWFIIGGRPVIYIGDPD